MQVERERKKAMMDELKHYINGKFAELEKDLLKKVEAAQMPKKVVREKATRGE